MSTFWQYPSISPDISCPQCNSDYAQNSGPKLGIAKSSVASLWDIMIIHLHTLQTCASLKRLTCGYRVQKSSHSRKCLRHMRCALLVFHCMLVVDSRLKTLPEPISPQPWRQRYDRDSSLQSRLVHCLLWFGICLLLLTSSEDRYAPLTWSRGSCSKILVVKLCPESTPQLDTVTQLTGSIFGYP